LSWRRDRNRSGRSWRYHTSSIFRRGPARRESASQATRRNHVKSQCPPPLKPSTP
jgi:hypothetical protein